MDAAVTFWVRDNPLTSAQNKADDVKNTFSSWDNCMKKDYCKWPAIILIVIASLIVASIVFCLVRCICCGLECCCGCFSCLNSCCSCCQPRRRRWGDNDRYRDEPPPFNPGGGGGYGGGGGFGGGGGYQAPPPAPIYVNVQAPPAQPASRYEPSRSYASFDTSSKRSMGSSQPYNAHEDTLPIMPTWKDAQTKHIETEEEEVEMDHLNNYGHSQQQPMLSGQSTGARAGPTPCQQTPGQGLYSDTPAHNTGDLADAHDYNDGYHDHAGAYAGAAGAVVGAAAVGGAAYAYNQHNQHNQHDYQQQQHQPYHQDYQQDYQQPYQQPYQQHASPPPNQGYQQTGVTGYGSPAPAAAAAPYGQAPTQHYPQTTSPPPRSNYTSPPPVSHQTTGSVSPVSTPAGLPSSLTPGNTGSGFQPPGQQQQGYSPFNGQQTGTTGGHQYSAYQANNQPAHGTWHDV